MIFLPVSAVSFDIPSYHCSVIQYSFLSVWYHLIFFPVDGISFHIIFVRLLFFDISSCRCAIFDILSTVCHSMKFFPIGLLSFDIPSSPCAVILYFSYRRAILWYSFMPVCHPFISFLSVCYPLMSFFDIIRYSFLLVCHSLMSFVILWYSSCRLGILWYPSCLCVILNLISLQLACHPLISFLSVCYHLIFLPVGVSSLI